MTDSAPKGVVARLKEFFGLKPGETLPEFMAECKALTDADKAWFRDEFNKMGLPTV